MDWQQPQLAEVRAVPDAPAPCGAGQMADILALSRAAFESVGRLLRSAPEIKANRIMSRWPLDVDSLLAELEIVQTELPIAKLAVRLGVSSAQLRSTALRLQRLNLVEVTPKGVGLTNLGRQKLAKLELARASVLSRMVADNPELSHGDAAQMIRILKNVIDRAEDLVDEQLDERP